VAVPYLLLQTVVVPAIFAILCYVLAGRLGKRVGWLAFISLLYTSLVFLYAEALYLVQGSSVPVETYQWAPSAGLTFGFLADNLSLPVALIISLVLVASSVYSMRYMEGRINALYGDNAKGRHGLYYLNYLLVSTGLIGITLSTNLIELYLFLELVLIPTFVIISLFGYVNKERVAITYIIWNQLGAFIFLAGILLLYSHTGSFDISLANLRAAESGGLAYWIVGFILIGWLVKMAIFGLHMWLPITEAEPPTSYAPIMAIISGIGTYVIVRLLLFGMPDTFEAFSLPLMAWAVLTMFYGGAVTLAQSDTKYLFAWSTVSQNAYSIFAIASWSVLGVAGGTFYFLSHIMGKFILFSVAGILLTQTGLRDIRKMGGLASKMPFTATLFLLGALILSAVPPTSGFQAEWIMFAGIFARGVTVSASYLAVAFLGLIATLLTVAYTLWPMRKIFFGTLPSSLENVKEAPLSMTIPLLAIVVVSILIGIYPDIVSKALISFANTLPIGGKIGG
jgi:NADH-quinone oxidoreductase subunit M